MVQIGAKFVKSKGVLMYGSAKVINYFPRSFYTAPPNLLLLEGVRTHLTGIEWAWNQSLSPRSSLARKLINTSAGVGILNAENFGHALRQRWPAGKNSLLRFVSRDAPNRDHARVRRAARSRQELPTEDV